MIGAAVKTRQARIALDVGKEAVRFVNPLLPETRSEMAIPLGVGARVLGALSVQSTRAGAFSDADVSVLIDDSFLHGMNVDFCAGGGLHFGEVAADADVFGEEVS